MNRHLPTSLQKEIFPPLFYRLKNNLSLKKSVFVFIFLFGLVPTLIYSQGIDCASATPITINGACRSNDSPVGTSDSAPLFSGCGSGTSVLNVGWYKFTVSGGPLSVTITGVGDRNLAIQLIGSTTNDCSNLSEMACVNAVVGTGTTFSPETTTITLPNGTYFIKVLNRGSGTMTLQSLCVTAAPSITSLGSSSGCSGSTVVINGTNLSGASAVTIGGTAVTSYVINSSTQITAVVGAGTTGTVSVTTSGGSATSAATFTVYPLPTVTNSSTASTCSGTGPNISLTASVPSTYTWTVGAISGGITGASAGSGAIINQILTNPSNSAAGTVKYIVTPTSTTGGCSGSAYTITVTVNPKPVVTNAATGSTCTGSSPNITLTASAPSTFTWTIGTITGGITGASAGGGATINQALTNPTNGSVGSVQYIVTPTATAGGCGGSPFIITVTVNPKPATVVSPVPATGSTGFCATGGGAVSIISWAAAATATSYDVYFGAGSVPATVTATVATTSYNTGSLSLNTTYFWRVVAKNSCGSAVSSSTFTFTTSSVPCYCSPTTATPANFFIKNVRFLGTLNDVYNDNNGFGNGFQDFTGAANKTSQVAGEGINIYVESNGADTLFNAWVDWNKDGFFDNTGPVTTTSELVFTSNGTRAISTTFGIVIPAGTVPGDYRIRIRNYSTGSSNYDTCAPFTGANGGEAEDYIIKVLSNCASNIVTVTDGVNCGPGAITLSAKGNSGTTALKWYDAETGGNLLATTTVDASLNASYTTPSINTTTTYYVTAVGSCESIFRTPVVARIKPLPNVTFDLPAGSASFCGDNNTLNLTSVGGNETVELFNEKFDSGMGLFTTTNSSKNNSTVTDTQWQNQASTFKPKGAIWSPAISSGFGGNRFAYATSDFSTRTVETILTTTTSYNTSNFTNLTLSFSAYYSYYGDTSPQAGGTVEGLFVEVSKDNGGTWSNLQTYKSTLGFGTRFDNFSIILNSSFIGITNLKIRFRYLAYWGDGLAIDNIKLSGDRPLITSFVWTAPNIGIFSSDCTTPYVNGTAVDKVCLKPSAVQLQTIQSWSILAQATLSNGCTADGTIVVQNNNKFWDQSTSNWNTTNWQPNTTIPDINKCVIIKQPVILNLGADGAAKNVSVESGGSLQIMSPRTLTINDYLRNNTTADKVNIESDANLIQQNEYAVNVGSITAKRSVTGLRNVKGTAVDYVYWGSPVLGQQTKGTGGFSPGTPNANFFSYRESNDRFYETADLTFTPGRGYAVQAEAGIPDKTYTFVGKPNNGPISYSLIKSPDSPNSVKPSEPYVHGYNMVANPYPSNITFEQLFQANSGLIYNTAWFWTNNIYEQYQKGSAYNGNNYSVINGTGGVSSTYSTYSGGLTSNGIIKVGQGFIVQAKSSGALNFKNSYGTGKDLRTGNAGNVFFQRGTAQKDRFWLSLKNPNEIVNEQLIGYVSGATDGFEQDYDNEAFDVYSDLFYSDLSGKKLVIQGKSENFTTEDKIDLGANFSQTGVYTIALNKAEGIFSGGQSIYLKDKEMWVTTNLSEKNYTFQAITGLSVGRFEIVYKPELTLSAGEITAENLWVYREADNFVIKASQKITNVELYDASGRLVIKMSPNSKQTKIGADKLISGVFVLKINLLNGEVLTRKIRK